jgi:hypothetical protein
VDDTYHDVLTHFAVVTASNAKPYTSDVAAGWNCSIRDGDLHSSSWCCHGPAQSRHNPIACSNNLSSLAMRFEGAYASSPLAKGSTSRLELESRSRAAWAGRHATVHPMLQEDGWLSRAARPHGIRRRSSKHRNLFPLPCLPAPAQMLLQQLG